MTYNLALANIVPPNTAFTKVNNVRRSVSAVAVSGNKVLITLASPVIYGDAVTVHITNLFLITPDYIRRTGCFYDCQNVTKQRLL